MLAHLAQSLNLNLFTLPIRTTLQSEFKLLNLQTDRVSSLDTVTDYDYIQ